MDPPEVNGDDCDIGIHVRAISDIRDGDVLLLPERVVAVCSPEFLDRNGPIADAKALLNHQLLSLSRPPSAEWQTWQGWFDALNISGERTHNYVSFNNYDMVTQSAVAGQGIALGWVGLIDGLLENGSLVQLTDHVVGSRSGYVMSEYRGRTSKGAGRVFDWIISQMGTV